MSKEISDKLRKQEETLVFETFTKDTALELGNAIVKTAKDKGVGIAVEITLNDFVLFKHSMEGTTIRNDYWLKRKANTVKFALTSSWLFSQWLEENKKSLDKDLYLSHEEYAVLAGGFPLKVKGVGTVGSICVSGLFHTDDHDLIVETLEKFLEC